MSNDVKLTCQKLKRSPNHTGTSHSKFAYPQLAVADINQDHSQAIHLASVTSDLEVTPAE